MFFVEKWFESQPQFYSVHEVHLGEHLFTTQVSLWKILRENTREILKIIAQFFLIVRVRVIRQMFDLLCKIGKPRSDLWTLSTTFYDLSVSYNLFSEAEIRQSDASGRQRI